MSTIRSGLTAVGLAALTVGTLSPAAAHAAPTITDQASAEAPSASTTAPSAPRIAFVQPSEGDKLSVAGMAPGARLAGIIVEGGGSYSAAVWNDRFATLVDVADRGKKATLVSYTPQGQVKVEFVLETQYAEGENEAPGTPVIHAVSQHDADHLVIEGTVTHQPDLFAKTEVWANRSGMSWDFTSENGSFSLIVPASRAGEIIDVTAYYQGHASETAQVELVPTERSTASDVHPLEVTSPTAGDVLAAPEATFAGSGIPNSQIVVTRDEKTNRASSTLCETRVTSLGDWSCTSPALPAGSYDTTISETPTWASAPKQERGAAFTVAETVAVDTRFTPTRPVLSSLTELPDGGLVARVISHNAASLAMTVDGDRVEAPRGAHGRFTLTLDAAHAGKAVSFTGHRGDKASPVLETTLAPVEEAAPSPLAAPRIHAVTADTDGTLALLGTTSYFQDEFHVPQVIVQKDGAFVGGSQVTWNGAFSVRLGPELSGEEVDVLTVRNGDVSEATTVTVSPSDENDAPAVFPLDVVSPAEDAVVPATTQTFEGVGIPGSTVEISTGGDAASTLDADLLTQVQGDGSWRVELDAPLAEGDHTMSVTETPYWDTLAPITSTRSFTVSDGSDGSDDEDLADLSVTSHTDGGRYSTGMATFTGRGTPDARLTGVNQWGTPMGSTRVNEDGDWSFARNLGPTSAGYDITFTMTPATGAPTQLTLHLDYEAPSQPLTVTSHVDGESYREGIARFTGTGTVGAQVVSTNQWGTQMGKATIGSDGTWAFSRNLGPTNPGYVLTFVATHGTDEQRATLTLTHQKDALVDVTMSSPVIRDGGITEAHRTVTFRGTATPFATVVGKNQWGTPFGSTTASSTGAFAFDRYVGPAGTTYQLTFEQKATDGTTKTTTGIDFVTGR